LLVVSRIISLNTSVFTFRINDVFRSWRDPGEVDYTCYLYVYISIAQPATQGRRRPRQGKLCGRVVSNKTSIVVVVKRSRNYAHIKRYACGPGLVGLSKVATSVAAKTYTLSRLQLERVEVSAAGTGFGVKCVRAPNASKGNPKINFAVSVKGIFEIAMQFNSRRMRWHMNTQGWRTLIDNPSGNTSGEYSFVKVI
jgi:hypothetical protein